MHGSIRRVVAVLLASALLDAALSAQGLVNPETEKKIDALLAKMTLEEKAGQLNQYASQFDITGPPPTAGASRDRYEQIRSGLVGSMFNVIGAEATRKAQRLAVE